MASPVGHSLLGLAMARVVSRDRPSWHWLLLVVFGANLPDLDFLPGLFVGDVNRYHQSYSHSLVVGLVFGIACFALARWRKKGNAWGFGVVAFTAYASHLLLDYFCGDDRAPYGQPLLWPLSSARFISPWTPLGGIRHGSSGASFAEFLEHVFSWSNAVTIGIECLATAPLLLLAWFLSSQRKGAQTSNRGAIGD